MTKPALLKGLTGPTVGGTAGCAWSLGTRTPGSGGGAPGPGVEAAEGAGTAGSAAELIGVGGALPAPISRAGTEAWLWPAGGSSRCPRAYIQYPRGEATSRTTAAAASLTR